MAQGQLSAFQGGKLWSDVRILEILLFSIPWTTLGNLFPLSQKAHARCHWGAPSSPVTGWTGPAGLSDWVTARAVEDWTGLVCRANALFRKKNSPKRPVYLGARENWSLPKQNLAMHVCSCSQSFRGMTNLVSQRARRPKLTEMRGHWRHWLYPPKILRKLKGCDIVAASSLGQKGSLRGRPSLKQTQYLVWLTLLELSPHVFTADTCPESDDVCGCVHPL